MKRIIFVSLLIASGSIHAQDFYFVSGAGTGTVSATCYYKTFAECDQWVDATYNQLPNITLVPIPSSNPDPSPPDPLPPENLPNVATSWWNNFNSAFTTPGVFDQDEDIIVMFGGTNNSTSIATFDADLEVYDDLGNYVETKSGSITMPLGSDKDTNGNDPRFITSLATPGNYSTMLCIGASCSGEKPITIVESSSGSSPDVSINWWNTFNSSWSTESAYSPGETITILFGGMNNSSTVTTFYADLKVFNTSGNQIATKSGSITMPAGSNKNQNGHDPRFFTTFSGTGSYSVQLCISSTCGSMKSLTIQ